MEDSQMLQASYEQDQAHCNYFDYAPTTTETVLSMNLKPTLFSKLHWRRLQNSLRKKKKKKANKTLFTLSYSDPDKTLQRILTLSLPSHLQLFLVEEGFMIQSH